MLVVLYFKFNQKVQHLRVDLLLFPPFQLPLPSGVRKERQQELLKKFCLCHSATDAIHRISFHFFSVQSRNESQRNFVVLTLTANATLSQIRYRI